MKVAIYLRVSDEKQAVKELSIPGQRKALKEYAASHGYEEVTEFVDEAKSGRISRRPAFINMINQCSLTPRPFDAILFWKFSRFARSREISVLYKSMIRKKGIKVISINEPIEDSPSGKLLEGMIEVFDEFYSENLAQDVIRGMNLAASKGYFVGGTVSYGLSKAEVYDQGVKRNKLDIDDGKAPVVRQIFSQCLNHKGVKEIAKDLNKAGILSPKGKRWNVTSIYQILTNEVYTGTLVWGKKGKRRSEEPIRVENAFPAIVDKDTFQKAQAILAQRAPRFTRPRSVTSSYLLGGMMKCGECGSGVVGGAYKSGQFRYYRCGKALRQGPEACPGYWLPADKIEGFVIDKIKHNILTDENLIELVRLTNEEIKNLSDTIEEKVRTLRAQLNDVEARLERLYDSLETGKLKLDELAPRISSLVVRKKELQQAIVEARNRNDEPLKLVDINTLKAYVEGLREVFASTEVLKQKAFLRTFVESIEVSRSDVTIHYTLPMPPKNEYDETIGVLGFKQSGGSGWI